MKTISTLNQAMLDSGAITLEWTLKITRLDGVVLRYTSGSNEATISGALYDPQPGFKLSSVTCTMGFGVDSGEITMLTTDEMTRANFLAGRWRGAVVEVQQYNWAAPTETPIPWPKYRLGNAKPQQGGFTLELRDLRQLMLQDMTRYTGQPCPYRLGSTLCGVQIDGSPVSYTFPFTITSVQSQSRFTCAAVAHAGDADYFTNGEVYFDDGPYADLGRPLWVLTHDVGGVITLAVPLYAGIAVAGQTGRIVAGCRKRKDEDCRDKFDNVLNFGGQEGVTAAEIVGGDA